jgi:hypothetical protein
MRSQWVGVQGAAGFTSLRSIRILVSEKAMNKHWDSFSGQQPIRVYALALSRCLGKA